MKRAEAAAEKMRDLKILRFFSNSDLRCMQDGLTVQAKDAGFDVKNLKPGEFLVFCNSARTALKILTVANIVVSVRHPENRKLDLNIIRLIPKYFNGTEFDYDKAMREVVLKKVA